MFSLSLWHLLLCALACTLLISHTYCDDRKMYIVYMGDLPTEGKEGIELLHLNMVQSVLISSDSATEHLFHSYKKSFNGFVARLTKKEAKRMAEMDGVVSVFESQKHKPQTTRSWDFLGFPQQVERSNFESDVIIGMIDTGIWPESDSFKGQGFGPPPSKWKGSCHNITCNNKIIGAKYFRGSGSFGNGDIKSPRDSKGHGSHCSSTAAGDNVGSTSLYGLGLGNARGGVPSARIAVYKVCWSDSCIDHDILAAFDHAIADGVDIISISIGPTQTKQVNYFDDVYAIGAFHASNKGIFTSKSADNNGPALYTMSNYAPWYLSVAATTIDRKFFTNVRLGNGVTYQGVSVNTFDLQGRTYPLIYAGDAPNINGGHNSSTSRYCNVSNSLDEASVKGKFVLCDGYGNDIVQFLSGAAGFILRTNNNQLADVAYIFPLPTTVVSQQNGTLILSYIRSTRNPTAAIFKSYEAKDSLAPNVASFSSRGPNPITPDILKPDIAAPGVDILAAWSPIKSISEVKGDTRFSNYSIISGTSMATPHAAGIAAYVKSFHPTWSPAAIKSALMTTATPMNSTRNPQAEFAYGAGELNPIKAVNPGLVYNISSLDYVRFLCGQGYSDKQIRAVTGDNSSSCSQTGSEDAWNLNLPSLTFEINDSTSSFSRVFKRTVTNVGNATSTYRAKVNVPNSLLSIQVNPDVLSFSSVGQNKSFNVTINGRNINTSIVSASLVWDDGTFQARSPIVVYNI